MSRLRVPLGRLPEDAAQRHGALRDYFCDKDAEAVPCEEGWLLHLAWPGGDERHVDPALDIGLKLWGGIARDQMALAQRRSGRVLRALYDTWTLHSWSEWFARAELGPDDPLTILHVDDHRDLGAPRLYRKGEELFDLISGERFDLTSPETVRAAIESGAVGMGSFLTPVLHRFPNADVRQLGQAPKVRSTVNYRIELAEQKDTLLAPGALRPAIALIEDGSSEPAGRYRITSNLDHWVEGIGPGPILLHVDMDYFNNRYDGDGDWKSRVEVLDPPIEDVLREVDRVTEALRSAGLVSCIVDAVIAYSPGFFPAELWEPADQRLQQGLEELYG